MVGVVWGGALIASVVPHAGVSWQDHVCGGIAGVIAAWLLSAPQGRVRRDSPAGGGSPARAGGGSPIGGADLHAALDRVLER